MSEKDHTNDNLNLNLNPIAPTKTKKQKHHHHPPRRTSRRLQGTQRLAELLVTQEKVVMITGAGLSVASGIAPFRSTDCSSEALWNQVIWTTATRQAFRKDPLAWYNTFWLPHFQSLHTTTSTDSTASSTPTHTTTDTTSDTNTSTTSDSTTPLQPQLPIQQAKHLPNPGHDAIYQLQLLFPNTLSIITQNIDGLHHGNNVIECHGRVGLYKCIPEVDSETDSEDDDDDDRPVHLGHARKAKQNDTSNCPFQYKTSIPIDLLEPPAVRQALSSSTTISLTMPPQCPHCHQPCPPQALLFDEGYHSHLFYQYQKMESLLAEAQVVVFIGTSFAVNITHVALEHAKRHLLHIFNFNISKDALVPSSLLNVEHIVGPSHVTLVQLLQQVKAMM